MPACMLLRYKSWVRCLFEMEFNQDSILKEET